MRLLASTVLAFAALAVGGCSKDNPNFCEGDGCQPTDAAIDTPIDTPSGCSTNIGVCSAPNLTCVADVCSDCDHGVDVDHETAACDDPAAPICGSGNDCRACATHEECAKGVCYNGTCPSNVLFVSPTGSDGGANDCTNMATPCLSLPRAITLVPAIAGSPDTNRRFVRLLVPGDYTTGNEVDINAKSVVIVGPPVAGGRAVVDRNGNGATFIIHAGSAVLLDRIAVNNGVNSSTADGINCATSTVTVTNVEVVNNQGTGILANGCDLTVLDSVITNNDIGGISVTGGSAIIVNDVLASNGGNTSSYGGLQLSATVANTSVVQSNTIVNNVSNLTSDPDGMECRVSGVTARNNIIFGNATHNRVIGGCTHVNTLYGPADPNTQLTAGTGNMLVIDDTTFRFANAGNRDYHLLTGGTPSVAKDKGTATGLAPDAMKDLDGEPRPQGTTDVGADEIP